MARVGFIGVGNMGGPMARNLIKAGHAVKAFDLSEEAMNFAVQSGARAATSVKDAARGVEFVVTMLPVGDNVRAVFLVDGVLAGADPGTVLMDCSTIDVETARAVHAAAAERGYAMLDAPVSGGVGGAEAATLTIMCGGDKATFQKALPVLQGMGKNIVHCGGPGLGQVTKICNNMVAGVISLATAEAFVMGEKLGVARQSLFDVLSTSSASSFVLTRNCPAAGPVPTSASRCRRSSAPRSRYSRRVPRRPNSPADARCGKAIASLPCGKRRGPESVPSCQDILAASSICGRCFPWPHWPSFYSRRSRNRLRSSAAIQNYG